MVSVDISSESHPFYTGKQKLLDTAGRVEKFQNKYKNSAYAKRTEPTEAAPATPAAEPAK